MAAHQRLARRNRQQLRRPRHFRDRSNPLEELEDSEVFDRFRFHKESIVFLLGMLDLDRQTRRNAALCPVLQLLCCLRFFATGSLHGLIADSLNISRQTAGDCIRNVAEQLATKASQFIKFPTGRDADRTKDGFMKIAGFPGVVGCIDGTFIRLIRPAENEQDFVNRKGFHSLNVMMCCDPGFQITSLNASWPGSVHDSRIFRTSALSTKFENGDYSGLLLGDSGFPCRRFILTPLLNPNTRAEIRFNSSLCKTRVIIEQTFGILKRRFQCLQVGLKTNPHQAVVYVTACAVLHNLGIKTGDIINYEHNDTDHNPDGNDCIPANNDGVHVRQHIIDTCFSN